MSVILRPLTKDDVPEVLSLEDELFSDDAWSPSMFEVELSAQPHSRHYIAATDPDGRIVGYAGLAVAADQGDVQTIAVRADRWGEGVGTALLTALLDEAWARGCEAVFLEVRADNPRAQALYERFGFVAVGMRRQYYQPSGVDAIVMCRKGGRDA